MKKILLITLFAIMVTAMGCSGADNTAQSSKPDTETAGESVTDSEAVPETEQADETESEELTDLVDDTAANLCLTGGEYLFKDYTYLVNEYNDEDGSYYDEYISEDGVQVIYEKGVTDYNRNLDIEDYMLEEAVKLAGDAEVKDSTIEASSYKTELSYPAYVAKFYSGNNEDTRSYIVYLVDTDSGLFMYGLSSAADYEEDMFTDADDVFPKLTIEENYRGLVSDESGFEEPVDLMDFLGGNIEEASVAIMGLEKDGESYSAKEEKSLDGLALAGPFIDVDADGNVTGISYSGEKYSVETLWVGNPMGEAGQLLKDLGWEFQSVDFAHGTAQYVVTYTRDNMELVLISDESGDFDKSEESDVTGSIATISVQSK